MNKSKYSSAALAVAMALAPCQAGHAQTPHPPPLKPGHSAGVQKAQETHTGLALIGTGAIIAIVVVAATTNGGGGNNNQMSPQGQVSTTTTAP